MINVNPPSFPVVVPRCKYSPTVSQTLWPHGHSARQSHDGPQLLRGHGPVTNLEEILVSDELLRPHAKHGHGNPGDALPPPPVFLETTKPGRGREQKTHTSGTLGSLVNSYAPELAAATAAARHLAALACERKRVVILRRLRALESSTGRRRPAVKTGAETRNSQKKKSDRHAFGTHVVRPVMHDEIFKMRRGEHLE